MDDQLLQTICDHYFLIGNLQNKLTEAKDNLRAAIAKKHSPLETMKIMLKIHKMLETYSTDDSIEKIKAHL